MLFLNLATQRGMQCNRKPAESGIQNALSVQQNDSTLETGTPKSLQPAMPQALSSPPERMGVKYLLRMHSALQAEVGRLLDQRASRSGASPAAADQIDVNLQVQMCFHPVGHQRV